MSQGTMKEVLKELESMDFPTKNPIKDKTRMNVVGGKEDAKKEKIIHDFQEKIDLHLLKTNQALSLC